MKTNVAKRSSQEMRAIKESLVDVLRPLVPMETEITATHPAFVAWFVDGRKVGE